MCVRRRTTVGYVIDIIAVTRIASHLGETTTAEHDNVDKYYICVVDMDVGRGFVWGNRRKHVSRWVDEWKWVDTL